MGWFSKAPAPKRKPMVTRIVQAFMRAYSGSVQSDLTSSWTTIPLPAAEEVRRELRMNRARSRQQIDRNDYAKRFVTMVQHGIVGPHGFALQAQVTFPNGQPDELANDSIERAWAKWSKARNCDYRQQFGFNELCRLIVRTVAADGEVFIRLRREGDYNFQLELIDPELVPVLYDEVLPNGNIVRMGIEYNASWRPVAYYVASEANKRTLYGDYYSQGRMEMDRVPVESMIHLYLAEKIGQGRGMPWLATSLMRLNMLGGYEEAALINARVGASKLGIIESPDGAGFGGIGNNAEGEIVMNAEPGSFEQVPFGTKLHSWDPQYPMGEFETFVKQALRGIAAGLGVSYASYANDLSDSNFASMRHGVAEEREEWMRLQDWFIDKFLEPVYTAWLETVLLSPGIPVKTGQTGAKLKPENIAKYRDVVWQGRRWPWIDPLKDVQAHTESINNGLKSRGDVIREQGRDPMTVWREIAREREILGGLGLDFTTGNDNPAGKATEPADESD